MVSDSNSMLRLSLDKSAVSDVPSYLFTLVRFGIPLDVHLLDFGFVLP